MLVFICNPRTRRRSQEDPENVLTDQPAHRWPCGSLVGKNLMITSVLHMHVNVYVYLHAYMYAQHAFNTLHQMERGEVKEE